MTLKDESIISTATNVVKRHFLGALSVVKYLKAVTSFFKQVTVVYFAPNFDNSINKPSPNLTDQNSHAGHTGKYRDVNNSNLQTKDKKEENTE